MKYIQIINFCKKLTIPELIKFKDLYKINKTREYLVACKVLEIRNRK